MPNYLPNIPQPGDVLSISQGQILGNFQKADSSFGNDHYAFSNGSANNGKHQVIRTPDQVTDPATATSEPAIYAKSVFTTPQVLQFSKIGGKAAGFNGSPLTSVNVTGSLVSSIAPLSTVALFNAAGAGAGTMIRCFIVISAAGIYNFNEGLFSFNGSAFQGQASPAPTNASYPLSISNLGAGLNISGSSIIFYNGSGSTLSYNATITFVNIT